MPGAQLRLETNNDEFIAAMRRAAGAVGELSAKINVGLANSFQAVNKDLRKFEQGTAKAGEAMVRLGGAMTVGLTVPLALAAKAGSDAFASYDSLKRGLMAVEKSVPGVESRLKSLIEIAKQPGIGFEEAIQGDVRLRAVGVSAGQSARALKEFGNAIALTGGGKAQLNEITVQMGQMVAKGKVMAQDLRPIIEAAPAVASAISNIFGTVSSKDISDSLEESGRSSVDFLNLLLVELAKGERVTGGWKNSLENWTDALFRSNARVFEAAESTFHLGNVLDIASNAVEGLSTWFSELSEPVKLVLLSMGAMAAIIPVVTLAIGGLLVSIQLINTSLATSVGSIALATAGYTLLVAAVVGASFAIYNHFEAYNALSNKMEELQGIRELEESSLKTEQTEVDNLIGVLTNHASTVDQVAGAKKALISLSPAFASALAEEEINWGKVGDAVGFYKEQLMLASETRILTAQLASVETSITSLNKAASLDQNSVKFWWENFSLVELYEGASGIQKGANRIINTSKGLLAEQKRITGELAALSVESLAHAGKGEAFAPKITPTVDPKDKKKKDTSVADLKSHNATIEKWAIAHHKKLDEIAEKARLDELDLDIKQLEDQDSFWASWIKKNNEFSAIELDAKKKADKALADAAKEHQRDMDDQLQLLNDLKFDGLEGAIQAIASGEGLNGAFKAILAAVGNFAVRLGEAILPVAIATKALINSPTPLKAFGLIALGSAVRGIASSMKIDAPRFAQGGVVGSPMLAMIGDNYSGKEMILPFERNDEFANDIASKLNGGGGGGRLEGAFRVKGNDLELLVRRAATAKSKR
jgi:tape measure domain-containing protein